MSQDVVHILSVHGPSEEDMVVVAACRTVGRAISEAVRLLTELHPKREDRWLPLLDERAWSPDAPAVASLGSPTIYVEVEGEVPEDGIMFTDGPIHLVITTLEVLP
jgi:hypothetical protein